MLYRPETQGSLVKHTYREIKFSQHVATTDSSTTLAGQGSTYKRTSPPFLKTPPEQVLIHHSPSPQLLALYGCTSRPAPTPLTPAGTCTASSPNPRTVSFCHYISGLSYLRQKGKSTYPYLIKINVTFKHHTEVLLLNLVFKERENPISFILSIFAKVCNSY